jgi:protein-tyrosine phosphatase
LTAAVAGALLAGESVLIHCAGGNGRTGLVAACVLQALGVDQDEAVAVVRAAGSQTENAEQKAFVLGWSRRDG